MGRSVGGRGSERSDGANGSLIKTPSSLRTGGGIADPASVCRSSERGKRSEHSIRTGIFCVIPRGRGVLESEHVPYLVTRKCADFFGRALLSGKFAVQPQPRDKFRPLLLSSFVVVVVVRKSMLCYGFVVASRCLCTSRVALAHKRH